MKFKSGDIVLVTGITKNISRKKTTHHVLAKVRECGKYDAILTKFPASELDRTFVAPISRCQLIEIEKVNMDDDIKSAKIGNLVASLYSTFGKEEKTIGRLELIKDVPGSIKQAGIRTSSKLVIVPYNKLIILEE